MEDPIQRHPTRPEQLDILTTLLADAARARAGSAPVPVLDLGCGTGYVAWRLLRKAPGLAVTGVDRSEAALAQASDALAAMDGRFVPVTGDLTRPGSIALPEPAYPLVHTCLTFHDLSDVQKRAVIEWVAGLLAPGGLFLIYDRVRLTEPALFELQASLWARLEEVHGRAMRTAASFAEYEADLGVDNRPAALEDYLAWLRGAGLAAACLHLHGNVALLAGARPES